MREQKDVKGLYEYIISHLSEKGVADITRLLINYTKGKTDRRKLYPTSILELAIRDEIQDILENTEDERLVNISDKMFNELVDIITYKVVYKNESIWENLDDVVSCELDNELDIESEEK